MTTVSTPIMTATAFALKIWNKSVEAEGTPVETYLRSRGLVNPPPPSLASIRP